MKYKKKQEVKKRIAAIIAMMIAIIMVLGLILPVFAAEQTTAVTLENHEKQVDGLDVAAKELGGAYFDADLSAGFDGMYLVGHSVPVFGEITNKGKAIKGELQVKAYTFLDKENNYKEYILYSKKLDLAEGARAEVDMEVVMGTVAKFLEVSVITDAGETVFRKNVPVKALSPDTSVIAVVSSEPEQLRYLSQLEENTSSDKIKVLFLEEQTLPASTEVMENFSAVILDNVDTSDLQQNQKNALSNWVQGGGLLVLGTGTHSSRVLSGLDFLGDFSIGADKEVSVLQTTAGERIPLSSPLTVTEIHREQAEPVWKSGETVLTDKIQVGSGEVLLHRFALGLAPFSSLSQAGAVLNAFYQEQGKSHWKNGEDIEHSTGGRPIADYFSRVLPPMENKTILLIFGVVILYILLVGPGVYFILKKKDKQTMGWGIIPISALVCTGIIFVLSRIGGYHEPIVQIASVTEIKQGADSGMAKVGINLMSPKKGDVTFSAEGMTDFYVPDPQHTWVGMVSGQNRERCLYKMDVGDSANVTFYDNGIWEINKLQTDTLIQFGGTVESDVHIVDKTLQGTVTNNTTVDFTDAYVNVNGLFIALGTLPAGESVTIKESYNEAENADAYGYIGRAVWQGEESAQDFLKKGKGTRRKAFSLEQQQDMMQSNMYEYQERPSGEIEKGGRRQLICTFYGFSEEALFPQEKYINGKPAKEMNQNMYFINFWEDLAYQKSFETQYVFGAEVVTAVTPMGAFYANYSNTPKGYCDLYNQTEQKVEVETVYAVDKALRVDAFHFLEKFGDNLKIKDMDAKIYNQDTGNWEKMQESYENASAYFNEQNQIQVRVTLPPSETVVMPRMSIKGGGRYA